jgi:hypothetical protein
LFPEAYTSKLQELQDSIEPMPFWSRRKGSVARAVRWRTPIGTL